ncbi:MAG: hypothetical protein N3B18_02265 [Desulfobacterota bacterium]|nr:hypothetical protein [Thermodesulfobacteriota bacterium]
MQSFLEEEFRKGYERALSGKQFADSLADMLNIFRTEKEREARREGFKKGLQEIAQKDLERKLGIDY